MKYPIGYTYQTNHGCTHTVTSYTLDKRYVIYCSEWSTDKYLIKPEDLVTAIAGISNKVCCCPSSPKYRWTYQQNVVRVNRKAELMGVTFLGIKGEYKGNLTKLILKNITSGNCWDTTPLGDFLRKDITDATTRSGRDDSLPEQVHIKQFMDTGAYHEGTKFIRSSPLQWKLQCPICETDLISKEGLGSDIFSIRHNNLKRGIIPCRCSPMHRHNKVQKEFLINRKLGDKGKFVSWVGEKSSRFIWKCFCGTSTEVLYTNFNAGKGCRGCTPRGYCASKLGRLYIVKWSNSDGFECIKYGITNRKVLTRIEEQNKLSPMSYEILSEFEHKDGSIIADIEYLIKVQVGKNFCKKELLPSGYTETVPNNHLILKQIYKIISDHL